MKTKFIITALFAINSFVLFVTPAMSHHSFAMYDQSKTITWTGVMTRFVAQANHAEMHFVPLGPDGKPLRGSDGKPIIANARDGVAVVDQDEIEIRAVEDAEIVLVETDKLN